LGRDTYMAVGTAVAGPLDMNGDGRGDLVVGAPGDDDGGSNAGAVVLVWGQGL